MISGTTKRVFILGCERSGSTWLSNIFDSHPNVEFFMEPFADYARIFQGFPHRNVYLSRNNVDLTKMVIKEYQTLHKIKYGFFYSPEKSIYFKWLDNFLVDQYQSFAKLVKLRIPLKIHQYKLLNLNTSNMNITQQFKKASDRFFQVTKELRLNFKVGLLARAFPDAKYLVMIRHPGSQISSIIRLFRKGNLGELKRALLSFIEYIQNCHRFEKYWLLVDKYARDKDNNIESKLILWWLINYEVLIEDLKAFDLNFQIVYHESLSENPYQVTSHILKFCQLSFDKQVKNYVYLSSIGNNNINSPVDTVRNSANYYKQLINAVELNLQRKIEEVISHENIIKEITCSYCVN